MVKCCICDCNCDTSDLSGGICGDCIEMLARRRKKVKKLKSLIAPDDSGQMEISEAGGLACMGD